MTSFTENKPSSIKIWMAAIRPATLTASIVPVAVGGSLAWAHHYQKPDVLMAALLGAIFIQIATNLHNDYEDFVRGADTEDRLGQARVTQKGWMGHHFSFTRLAQIIMLTRIVPQRALYIKPGLLLIARQRR